MDNFGEYKYLLGETILLYQLMESDLRWIFAGLSAGDVIKNKKEIDETSKGLGEMVRRLKELDRPRKQHFFSLDAYDMLFTLARERNYFCHNCALEFAYIPHFEGSVEFKRAFVRLRQAHTAIVSIQRQTEQIRTQILNDKK